MFSRHTFATKHGDRPPMKLTTKLSFYSALVSLLALSPLRAGDAGGYSVVKTFPVFR